MNRSGQSKLDAEDTYLTQEIANMILRADNICTEGTYSDCLVVAREIVKLVDSLNQRNPRNPKGR